MFQPGIGFHESHCNTQHWQESDHQRIVDCDTDEVSWFSTADCVAGDNGVSDVEIIHVESLQMQNKMRSQQGSKDQHLGVEITLSRSFQQCCRVNGVTSLL